MNLYNFSILTLFGFISAALALVLAHTFGGYDLLASKPQWGTLAHIFISFFAVSILGMASLQALLLGLQNFLLKHHRPSAMLRLLPPLQTMEGLLFVIIWCGQLFLCASLFSGFFFKAQLLTPHLLPKTILALSAWFALTLLLVGRYFFGWRGPTAIRWTLCGSVLAILSYFGTKALLL